MLRLEGLLNTEAAEREKAARDAAALKRRTPIGKLSCCDVVAWRTIGKKYRR